MGWLLGGPGGHDGGHQPVPVLAYGSSSGEHSLLGRAQRRTSAGGAAGEGTASSSGEQSFSESLYVVRINKFFSSRGTRGPGCNELCGKRCHNELCGGTGCQRVGEGDVNELDEEED